MRWFIVYAIAALVVLATAHHIVAGRKIDVSLRLDSAPAALVEQKQEPGAAHLRMAVAPITLPVRGFAGYEALAEYLSGELKEPVDVVFRDTYAQINELLSNDHADIAFICLGGYLAAPESMDLLAATVVKGRTEYEGFIIVPQNSSATTFADLRGKNFLFTDIDSNTGHAYPCLLIQQFSKTSDDFFSSTKFTGGHDRSIQAIAWGLADGAAVSSAAYDATITQDPSLATRIKTIERSKPYPSPPVVVRKNLPAPIREKFLQALMRLPSSEKGHAIATSLGIDGFTQALPDAYTKISRPKADADK